MIERRMLHYFGKLLVVALLIAVMGCQSVGGVDLNQAMQSGLDVKSSQGSATVSLQLMLDPDKTPDEETRKMADFLNQAKLELQDIKMESQEKVSVKGNLALTRLKVPFHVYLTPERTVIQIEGAKKAIVRENGLTGWSAPDLPESIDKEVRDRINLQYKENQLGKKLVSFLVKHLPNPQDINVTPVSENVHNEKLDLYKVESTVYGNEFIPLLKDFIKNISRDDQGLKELIGQIYDVIWPIYEEVMKREQDDEQIGGNPYLQSLFEMAGDKEMAVDMIHNQVKQFLLYALIGLDGAVKQREDSLGVIFNDKTYLKTRLYLDRNLTIRKSEMELALTPLTEHNDGISSVKVMTRSEVWNINQPVKADVLEPGDDAYTWEPGDTFADFVKLLDKQSSLYKFLKDDLQVTKKSIRLYVDEQPVPGYNRPFVRDGVTYVPARFVADRLNADVSWNEEKRQVTIVGESGTTIKVTVDSNQAEVDGKTVFIEGKAVIQNDLTYVPVRFIAENLGGSVTWDESAKMVGITIE